MEDQYKDLGGAGQLAAADLASLMEHKTLDATTNKFVQAYFMENIVVEFVS